MSCHLLHHLLRSVLSCCILCHVLSGVSLGPGSGGFLHPHGACAPAWLRPMCSLRCGLFLFAGPRARVALRVRGCFPVCDWGCCSPGLLPFARCVLSRTGFLRLVRSSRSRAALRRHGVCSRRLRARFLLPLAGCVASCPSCARVILGCCIGHGVSLFACSVVPVGFVPCSAPGRACPPCPRTLAAAWYCWGVLWALVVFGWLWRCFCLVI